MRNIILAILIVICSLVGLRLLSFIVIPPPKYQIGKPAYVLTNTHAYQAVRPTEYFNMIFSESGHNPYTYGWKGNDLYFKDAADKQYVWSAESKKITALQIDNPIFLRQSETRTCDPKNRPNYSEKMLTSFPGDINQSCYLIKQNNTKVEFWPVELNGLLSFGVRQLVVIKDEQRFIITEHRSVSDAVLSEDGKYLAITATNLTGYTGSFEPNNIHVLSLE